MRPLIVFCLAAILIAAAGFKLYEADAGISTETLRLGATPISVLRADDAPEGPRPVVVISHGFAGSQQLMRPFAVSLARRGFIAVTFDYYGHGRNLEPLSGDVTKIDGATQNLVAQTGDVVNLALSLPDASGELGILGHSMASDIIVRYAQSDPRVAATVAVSMFSTAVTADAPKNLLVIVGNLEGFLKEEALKVQGMVSDTPTPGVTVRVGPDNARRIVFADGVEHVGVLFSESSMREAADWLGDVFGAKSASKPDTRGPWIMLLLLGVGALAWPLSRLLPTVSEPPVGAALAWKQLLPAALTPAVLTPLSLFWFPADFMGVLVGGYLAVHFAVYGLLTFATLLWLRRGQAPRASKTKPGRFVAATILATLYSAALVAVIMDTYVSSFAINALRAPLLLVMLFGTLAYFAADEWLTHGAVTARGGHLFTRFCFLLSLGIAVALSFEDLFFLLIIAGVIVLYFLVYGLFSRWLYQATGNPGVGAIANGIAFAWALTAVFPLMAG